MERLRLTSPDAFSKSTPASLRAIIYTSEFSVIISSRASSVVAATIAAGSLISDSIVNWKVLRDVVGCSLDNKTHLEVEFDYEAISRRRTGTVNHFNKAFDERLWWWTWKKFYSRAQEILGSNFVGEGLGFG